jgi:hypothetical protein
MGDVAMEPEIKKTPLPGTMANKDPTHKANCPENGSEESSLSSREPTTGLELAQECTPDLLPNSNVGQAGQAGKDQPGNRTVPSTR